MAGLPTCKTGLHWALLCFPLSICLLTLLACLSSFLAFSWWFALTFGALLITFSLSFARSSIFPFRLAFALALLGDAVDLHGRWSSRVLVEDHCIGPFRSGMVILDDRLPQPAIALGFCHLQLEPCLQLASNTSHQGGKLDGLIEASSCLLVLCIGLFQLEQLVQNAPFSHVELRRTVPTPISSSKVQGTDSCLWAPSSG